MRGANAKPARLVISWSARAQKSLDQTIGHVYAQDTNTARLIIQRLQKALDLIATQPAIGTPTKIAGLYRFPIPKTGHTIEYRIHQTSITIMRWARHTRKS
ncbi:hypothetical protein GJ697_18195 [Pseudoduganella sp. FT25W]|jgi:plasmid stabilization system protein ParE|uniref:Type II toxin-antitoxin system RelE/ParE family toxin n=1 Tax=Duganella alba TaxID=2666081 RepID=A0A6L5QLG1_9BURK|nr:hypothetical protein [Duganella alba]MRX17408.1 hypothetical protein [Duganella alba]